MSAAVHSPTIEGGAFTTFQIAQHQQPILLKSEAGNQRAFYMEQQAAQVNSMDSEQLAAVVSEWRSSGVALSRQGGR